MRSHFLLLAMAIVASAGCGDSTPRGPLADKVGSYCTVRLRRGDALGAAGDLPIGPETDSQNGVEINVSGHLAAERGGWVTIVDDTREMHIPKEAILLLEFPRKSDVVK